MVDKIKSIGGVGVKLLGAGSGGFLLVRFPGGMNGLNLADYGLKFTLTANAVADGVSSIAEEEQRR